MKTFLSLAVLATALLPLSAPGAENGPPLPTVVVGKAVKSSGGAVRRYAGAVEAIRKVDVMPRVTGTLLKTHFEEGSLVNEGALLYELEDTTYRAAVEILKAQKEQQEATLRYAELQFQRSIALRASNAVAETSHDKATLDRDSARARLKEIAASLVDAENNLSYTRIHAPLAGRIGKSIFSEGNLISPQAGKLTDIVMTAPIHVRFSLSERIFRREFGGRDGIGKRALVRILLADNTLYAESARVSLVDNKINATSNSITLWAVFENKDQALNPGSFVTVLLSAGNEENALAIAPSALIPETDGSFSIYVLDAENRVSRRKVKTGDTVDGLQVIKEGIDGTERIILDGTHKTSPGGTVVPVAAKE